MIVVIGLGNIGLAIGQCLVERGQDVVGVDLAEERRAAWQAATGLGAAATLDDVPWRGVSSAFVIVRLTDQAGSVLEALRELADGEGGGDGLACFVVTTLEADFARELGRYGSDGLRVLELPVSGGERGARAGTLTAMVAGPLTAADRALLAGTIVDTLVEFPTYGQPTLAKLFNNVTAAYNARALAEMLVLADANGLDPVRLREVLLTSSGGSWMTDAFLELVDDLLDKDVTLLRHHVGDLPTVSLGPDDDLLGRLRHARALLTRAR